MLCRRRDARKSKYQKVYTGIDGISLILETEERDDDQILSMVYAQAL